jgi:proline iminopeptidase
MFVEVNGTRLFFDVEGSGLVPDGPRMRTKPALILLHGGPGFQLVREQETKNRACSGV